jgi:hypothetical protein
VQTGAADRLGLIRREDPVDELLAEVEHSAEPPQQLDLLLQQLRLLVGPRQPRTQVLQRRVDRLLQERRVARLPAAHDQALGLDPVGRRSRQGWFSVPNGETPRVEPVRVSQRGRPDLTPNRTRRPVVSRT